MERISDLKFQQLNACEMSNVKGGDLVQTENYCGYDHDKLTDNEVAKSKNDGDWFWKKDDWLNCARD